MDELAYLIDPPLVGAINVALAKAQATAAAPDEVVVGADTLVVIDNEVLGKPVADDDARHMLTRLRRRAHDVLTGVSLVAAGRTWAGVVDTRVDMRDYTDAEIERYIGRGEPFDKAGGYAIQDHEFRPVERIEGCYLNVVGFPLCALAAGLITLGIEVERAGTPPCVYCKRSGY